MALDLGWFKEEQKMARSLAIESASQPDIPPSVVKSAGRALQILEFFDIVQREACVSEISRALSYPQSSTSVLLRSLVAMGYLQNDRYRRSYFPTRRVSLLGNWVDPALIQQGALLAQADELARTTKQTVVMATTNGLYAQYIYVSRPIEANVGGAAGIGVLRPLATTAVGKALMSTFDDAHIAKLVRRINAERPEASAPINPVEFASEMKAGRKRGYFAGTGAGEESVGIATTVRRERQLLAIGIEAGTEFMGSALDSVAVMLRNLVSAATAPRALLSA